MTFVEPLITEQLWHWLESEKNWRVDSEIDTGNGRIDLACRTNNDEYIGIELKAGSGLSPHSRLPEQLWRYVDSGVFDAIYFASPETGEAAQRLRSSTSEPVHGIQALSRSVLPPELGLIEVPLPLDDGLLRSPEKALNPSGINNPEVVRSAERLSRTNAPTFAPREEPQIRHTIWGEFGGLPEGIIPNVTESEKRERPIDLIAFEGSQDPSKIYQEPASGEVIGVEVKGVSSYSPKRVTRQLKQYLEPEVLTRLYLAVPAEVADRAVNLYLKHDDLSENIGILAVHKDGAVDFEKEAPPLELRHDGYKCRGEVRKTGYGAVMIEGGRDVSAPFVLSTWREPLTDPDGEPVVWNYDPRETENVIPEIGRLRVTEDKRVDRRLKSEASEVSTARAYLLTGCSADPFLGGGRPEETQTPRCGYVRLSVTGFDTDEGEFALDLHFGRGSREGGYICLAGSRVDALVSILSSLEYIEGGKVSGQGKYIDLRTFENTPDEKLYEHGDNTEQLLHLEIEADRIEEEVGALLRIAEDRRAGVEVRMTETQRIDLLRTVRVLRFGRASEIPGWEEGNYRIGPDGNDTWDWGTEVEEVHNPIHLGGSPPSTESIVKKVQDEHPELPEEDIRKYVVTRKEHSEGTLRSVTIDEIAQDLAPRDHDEFLREYSEIGTYGVQVLSQRDEKTCEPCRVHDGSVYTIEEALRGQPLPHDDCENLRCRCEYLPILDQETYEERK